MKLISSKAAWLIRLTARSSWTVKITIRLMKGTASSRFTAKEKHILLDDDRGQQTQVFRKSYSRDSQR